MRLIDADTIWYEQLLNTGNKEHPLEWAVSRSRIDNMPTIEVVRCKDCKKYIPCQKLPIGTSKWCDLFDRATCEMNYCGWGERRKDEID